MGSISSQRSDTLLPLSALQKGTFPFERTAEGAPVADYGMVKRMLGAYGDQFANEAHRLDCRNPDIDRGLQPYWVQFLNNLGTLPQAAVGLAVFGKLKAEIDTQPYALPFETTAAWFIEYLDRYRQVLGPNSRLALSVWYVDHLVETARYALHVDYKASGIGYSQWCRLFEDGRWMSIATDYPVLLRWLATIDEQCRAVVDELITRLAADRDELSTVFGIAESAAVLSIRPGLSDPHRKGRSVMQLTFVDGTRIVYKPKPLHIDAALYALAQDHRFGFLPLKTVLRDQYGWVEDVHSIAQPAEARQSSVDIGKFSGIMWLLNASDLHTENVLSTLSGINALDLETLLLPELHDELHAWRQHTLFTTQLFSFAYGENRPQSISAFNPSNQLEFSGPQVEFHIHEDDVVIEQRLPRKWRADKCSTIAESERQQILDGFSCAVSLTNREHLLSFISDLNVSTRTRIVFRDTIFYVRLLDRMRQPRFLRDGALMYCDLLSLHAAPATVVGRGGKYHALVQDEIIQLLRGDVPYFWTKVGSTELNLSADVENRFFAISGRDRCAAKLRDLDISDEREQRDLIDIALGTYRPQVVQRVDADRLGLSALSDQIASISRQLVESAYVPNDVPARWLSLFGDTSGDVAQVHVGDNSFFAGAWGILMTLEALNDLSSDAMHRDFLDKQASVWCQYTALKHYRRNTTVLGFSGIGGEVFAKARLLDIDAERWRFLADDIQELLIGALDLIAQDRLLDVVGGVAGLILGCDQVLHAHDQQSLHPVARDVQSAAAKHLIKTATEIDDTIAWLVPASRQPLLGFAHGWSGIIVALATVLRHEPPTAESNEISQCLQRTSGFPVCKFTRDLRWLDYRTDRPAEMNRTWCNGKTGLLRGLIEIQPHSGQPIAELINTLSVELIGSLGHSDIYRFCCGEMGVLDLVIDLKDTNESLINRAATVAQRAVLGLNASTEHLTPERAFPALFQGRAGVLYTASRLLSHSLPSLSGQNLKNGSSEIFTSRSEESTHLKRLTQYGQALNR